jgi:hypothetical protein
MKGMKARRPRSRRSIKERNQAKERDDNDPRGKGMKEEFFQEKENEEERIEDTKEKAKREGVG